MILNLRISAKKTVHIKIQITWESNSSQSAEVETCLKFLCYSSTVNVNNIQVRRDATIGRLFQYRSTFHGKNSDYRHTDRQTDTRITHIKYVG